MIYPTHSMCSKQANGAKNESRGLGFKELLVNQKWSSIQVKNQISFKKLKECHISYQRRYSSVSKDDIDGYSKVFINNIPKKYINQCHCIAGSGDVKIAITSLQKDSLTGHDTHRMLKPIANKLTHVIYYVSWNISGYLFLSSL